MMKRLSWAVLLAVLLVRPCEAHHPGLNSGYRQFTPYQSLVAVQAIPAYYTGATYAPCPSAYAGYYSAPALLYAAPPPCPPPVQLLIGAPTQAPPPCPQQLLIGAPAPLAAVSDYASLGQNTTYGADSGCRVRYGFSYGGSYPGGYGFNDLGGYYRRADRFFRARFGYGLDRFHNHPVFRGAISPLHAITGGAVAIGRAFASGGPPRESVRSRVRR